MTPGTPRRRTPTSPGCGIGRQETALINVRLAQLAAVEGDREAAVNFYRASIYGTWPGDAIARRREVRLELARYLIAGKQFALAREELRIAGSNAGADAALDRQLSDLLVSADDPQDALDYQMRVLRDRPADAEAAVVAAQLSDRVGDTAQALTLSDRALRLLSAARPETPAMAEAARQMRGLRSELERMEALDMPESLPAAERARRVLADATIARGRLAACLAATETAAIPAPLAGLSDAWTAIEPSLNARTLARDHDGQDRTMRLIDTTETQTRERCGMPAGDDALLLRLAERHAQAAGSTVTPTAPPQATSATLEPTQP